MKNKINHTLKCQICGAPATRNCQECWVVWEIDAEGNYSEISTINDGDNEFYCTDCYNKEYNKLL